MIRAMVMIAFVENFILFIVVLRNPNANHQNNERRILPTGHALALGLGAVASGTETGSPQLGHRVEL